MLVGRRDPQTAVTLCSSGHLVQGHDVCVFGSPRYDLCAGVTADFGGILESNVTKCPSDGAASNKAWVLPPLACAIICQGASNGSLTRLCSLGSYTSASPVQRQSTTNSHRILLRVQSMVRTFAQLVAVSGPEQCSVSYCSLLCPISRVNSWCC